MTDYEFLVLGIMFDKKEMTRSQISAYISWTEHYHESSSWATPEMLIDHLKDLPDRV
jgi:hypothetical protein